MMKISNAVASSIGNGIADDALKDEDNGFWLVGLPVQIRSVWKERFLWIRWVDRLAEQDQIVQPGGKQFPAFYRAWKRLYHSRFLAPRDRHWHILRAIESTWFLEDIQGLHQLEIDAWNCYMEAIADYHRPQLTITTLQEYETMLDRLAGACFQLLPFLEDHHRAIARRFGLIDQFYNNLRDLYEDAQQGVCYFPTDVLARFGLTQHQILTMSCFQHPGYQPLMKFWVETYLVRLRQRNLGLLFAQDLHPAWQCLTAWFVHRYLRIEQILRDCQYNFVTFAEQYWPAVQQDLNQQSAQLKQGNWLERSRLELKSSEIAKFVEHPSLAVQSVDV